MASPLAKDIYVTIRCTAISVKGIRIDPGGCSMQLLYEEAAKAGLRPDAGPSWGSDRGSLPLPILLRIPRFAIREKAPAPPQSAWTAPCRRPSFPRRIACVESGRLEYRPRRRKMIILAALMLAVVSVGIVSQNPHLLEPLIQRQSELVPSRDSHDQDDLGKSLDVERYKRDGRRFRDASESICLAATRNLSA